MTTEEEEVEEELMVKLAKLAAEGEAKTIGSNFKCC